MNLELLKITWEWGIIFSLLVLAAIAAMRVGIFCLAVETIFLNTAIAFSLTCNLWNALFMGVIFGITAGLLTAIIFFLLVVMLRLEEIVTGIGLNIFSIGTSSLIVYLTTDQRYAVLSYSNNVLNTLLMILVFFVWLATFFILNKSIFRARLIAVGQSTKTSKISNISVVHYRAFGLMLTGIAATTAGLYFAYIQRSVHLDQWNEGIGFLALGVAFASRGSLLMGLLVAFALAGFRALSLVPSPPEWVPAPDTLLPAAPYIFLISFIAVLRLVTRCKKRYFSKYKFEQTEVGRGSHLKS